MSRKFFVTVCAFFVLFFAVPGFAAGAAAQKPQSVDPAAVKNLITTLESDTARAEFVGNLKLLLKQQSAQDDAQAAIAPLTKTLGVESFADRFMIAYQDFLNRNGLKGSTVGKLALSGGALFGFLLLIVVARRVGARVITLLEKAFTRLKLSARRPKLYGRVIRFFSGAAIFGLMIYTACSIWVPARYNPFEHAWFLGTLKTGFNIGFILFLAGFFWELTNVIIQLVFIRMTDGSPARAKTIMPIVRNMLFLVFSALFALILLSEIGVNIMPLLAGAGIVGVAIGFGAQSMVRDFLTGFTIIMEDVMRVGDVVRIAGHAGQVEKITLRKVQLRDVGGVVFTIPFSEILTVENMTKDFSFYPLSVGVSYSNDTDDVCRVMREVDAEMRADPVFSLDMLEPIDIQGVDAFAESAVIIKARLKTRPLQQWIVGREFNRRMKKAFDAAGIEIPFPQRVVTVRQEGPDAGGAAAVIS